MYIMNEIFPGKLEAVGQNLLLAVGYGDSLGLPVETKRAPEIRDTYGEIRSLLPIVNPYFGEAPAGTWSDDTELSLATAEALIKAGDFSMDSVAENHVLAMEQTPTRSVDGKPLARGWGKGTWESVQRLKEGTHTWRNSGNPDSEGNGVLMKLSPLALWQAVAKPQEANQQIESFATMTHANDLSVVTAMLHRDMLARLLEGSITPDYLVEASAETALVYEKVYPGARHETSTKLGALAAAKKVDAAQITALAPRGGFWSPETLVMAYGAFVIESSFPECVYKAVSLGGDTDSVCSIVGAMSVMNEGKMTPPEDIEVLNDKEHLSSVGAELVASLNSLQNRG